jgi:PAS domain S-box-containing protein
MYERVKCAQFPVFGTGLWQPDRLGLPVMNLGPDKPRRTHPTGHRAREKKLAPFGRAENFKSSLHAIANIAAPGLAAAHPLDILVKPLNEFVFVLRSDGTIRTIWTAKLVERPRASLLRHPLSGMLGTEPYPPFAETFERVLKTGRSKDPEYLLKFGHGPTWFPARVIPFAEFERLANPRRSEMDIWNPLSWSDAMYKLLGLAPNVVIPGDAFLMQIIDSDGHIHLRLDCAEAIAQRRNSDRRRGYLLPDGGFRARQRQPPGYVGTAQELTRPDSALEKLQKSEALLAQAEQLANLGCWELDLRAQTVNWSDQMYRLMGLEPRNAVVTVDSFWDLVHPDDRERAQREILNAIAQRQPVEGEVRCVLADGRVRTLLRRAVPLFDEAGEPLRLVGTNQDVTERKIAEERLRSSELLLAQAEEIANLGSWEFDAKTRKMTLSKQLLRMYGLESSDQWDEEHYWQSLVVEDRQRVRQLVDQAIAGCCPFEFVARYRMPDGSIRTCFRRGVPIPGEDGKTERVGGIEQDISEQMRVEEELRRLSQQLMRTRDAERRQMARELHETVGQSLAALKMVLGQLRDALPGDDEGARELVQTSVELAEDAVREVRVVSYLMHPPMLDEGGLGLALQWYARGFSERSGIQAKVEVADEFGRYPQEIETTVFRVVQEALTNVHRYSGSRTVTIRLERDEGQIRTEVRDEGCGVALPGPAISRGAPLGVGIAGMRERVKQLDGVFEVESAPGRGTTVRAVLPIPARLAASGPTKGGWRTASRKEGS